MTRRRWIIALIWLFVFWLLAGAVWLPWLQRRLERIANQAVSGLAAGYAAPEVQFAGQQAQVKGKVRHESQKTTILNRLRHELRVPAMIGGELNPVTQVKDEIDVVPYPPGWLLLAAQGSRGGVVYGTLATEYEARDLGRLFQERWAKEGKRLVYDLKHAPGRFDESSLPGSTVETLPPPQNTGGGDSAQVFLSRPGQAWERLTLEAPDDVVRKQFSTYPISEDEWNRTVFPALARCRSFQKTERERVAEEQRQRALPPPHVIFAVRDRRLLLRGEVATLKIKRELLNEVITQYPQWRVLDDLRVNAGRRNAAAFGPLTQALLPATEGTAKTAFLGLPDAPWQPLDWQEGMDADDLKKLLPTDLPVTKIQSDWRMVQDWLQGSTQGIPTLPIPAQPSFVTLVLLPDKVIAAGQVAEEPNRARIAEALRQAYGDKTVILDEGLLARGTCEPSADVEQTVRSLPPLPATGQPPVVAFARPGHVWQSMPASPEMLEPGRLASSGLLPSQFPAAMAEHTLASEAYDHLRHYWRQQGNSPSPAGKPAAP